MSKIKLPITVCSSQKSPVRIGMPSQLHNNRRIRAFTHRYGNYIILSRKDGLRFSYRTYENYEDFEILPDNCLMEILKRQALKYSNLKLFYYNPRPLTLTKYFNMLKEAGFDVEQFRQLKDYKENKKDSKLWSWDELKDENYSFRYVW